MSKARSARGAGAARAVYAAICAVSEELARKGVDKRHLNLRDQYFYRSIEDVQNCLSPLLPRHRLCILPRMVGKRLSDCIGEQDERLTRAVVRIAFDVVSAVDGSKHTVEMFGEALDGGDKAIAKATTAAYKAALVQLFCIPTLAEESDASSHRLRARQPQCERAREREPDQGWERWSADIFDLIAACQRPDALGRLRTTYRAHLAAIGRERPDLYQKLGAAFAARQSELEPREARSACHAQADGSAQDEDTVPVVSAASQPVRRPAKTTRKTTAKQAKAGEMCRAAREDVDA